MADGIWQLVRFSRMSEGLLLVLSMVAAAPLADAGATPIMAQTAAADDSITNVRFMSRSPKLSTGSPTTFAVETGV